MKTADRLLRLALLLGLSATGALFAAKAKPAPAADNRVTVVFTNPEKFTDLKDSFSDSENYRGRDQYLPLIEDYVQQEAGRFLADGQKLTVTFSDIDLAGDFEPWRGVQFDDIRVVKDLYVPRLTFSYKVTDAAGVVVKEGERRLVDLGFQMRMTSGFREDPLRYEKDMLRDWMRSDLRTAKS